MPVYPVDKEVNLIKEKDYIENGYNSISIATEMLLCILVCFSISMIHLRQVL